MTTTEAPTFTPGVYDNMPNDDYHADPVPGGSLSSTGARKLLAAPALFKHEQDNPRPPRRTFDFGHAAHQQVLGNGPELAVIDVDDWRTKAAKEQRDQAYAEGMVPILAAEYAVVVAMADAIRAHPVASALFHPERGKPEQSLFWRDHTGPWLRARLDFMPHAVDGQRFIVADYKTAVSADPADIPRHIYQHGYHQQAPWYLDAVQSLDIADDPAFVFVFQEKTAPYLVTVTELDADALVWGHALNRKAIDTYRRCVETGQWPGYTDDVIRTELPGWATKQYENARDRGDI